MEGTKDQEPLWSEAKEIMFKKAIEDFKASNLRIPTAAEEDELWHQIFYMKENE